MIGSRGLRRQILVSFVGFAAAVSILFAITSFIVAYVVEDTLLEAGLEEEVAHQQAHWRSHGRFTEPMREYVSVYASPAAFPRDLREAFRRSGPASEVGGERGRHYHILRFSLSEARYAYIVAEVGGRLAVRSLQGELVLLLAAIAAGFLTTAGALGFWLANRTITPLGRLADAVSAVPSGEVPQIRAADFPANEVGVLARALEASLERARGFVDREIRFTRDASHELRTPLAVIRSSAELICARTPSPDLQRPLQRILEASQGLERTIDLLLLLAREERTRSAPAATLLLPLVEKAVLEESARFRADAFKVSISVPADAMTELDPRVAGMMISNLVSNVFRHCEGGVLRIHVDGADLVVADDGPGIPPDVEALLCGGEDGTHRGLGLSIVARLCRLHEVAVRVDRGPQGAGIRLALVSRRGTQIDISSI